MIGWYRSVRGRGLARTQSIAATVVVIIACIGSASAIPLPMVPREGWVTDWWSWAHWWEANQQDIIDRLVFASRELQPGRVDIDEELRDRAIAALLDKTSSKETLVAATAVVALGRSADSSVTEQLIALTQHERPMVRRAAWVAVGLNGDAAARAHLIDAHKLGKEDSLGWLVAVGLLEDPDDELLKRCYSYLKQQEYLEAQRIAAWAIRVQNPPGTTELMRKILHGTTDAYLASEAILALGTNRDEASERLLSQVYLDIGGGHDLPSLSQLHNAYYRSPSPGIHQIRGKYGPPIVGIRSAAAIALGHYVRPADEKSVARRNLSRPYRPRSLDQQKAMPRINQGGYNTARADPGPYPFVDNGWVTGYSTNLHATGHAEKRLGLISLGLVGGEEEVEQLLEVMRMKFTFKKIRPEYGPLLDPNRAFAAISLGLYLQRAEEHYATQGAHRRKRIDRRLGKLVTVLQDYMTDPQEPEDFRAACALGLGLSGYPEAADALKSAAETLEKHDMLLAGYITLGLGLLGDSAANELGRQVLQVANGDDQGEKENEFEGAGTLSEAGDDVVHASTLRRRGVQSDLNLVQILGLRAAILGLACVDDQELSPELFEILGREYFTSEQAIRSLKWRGDTDVARVLVEILEEGNNGKALDILAVWGLGELLDPNHVSRLNRLMQDVNFTLPNKKFVYRNYYQAAFERSVEDSPMYIYRAYAAPFMYRRLLFGLLHDGEGGSWR